MKGNERYERRGVDVPENFDEWPENARIEYLRGAMKRDELMQVVIEESGCDDEEVKAGFTKDQLAQIYLALAESSKDA